MREPDGGRTRLTKLPGPAPEAITGSVFKVEFPSNIRSWEELAAGRDSLIAAGCNPNSILIHADGDLTMTADILSPKESENYSHVERLLDRAERYVRHKELLESITDYFQNKYGGTK